MNIHFLVAKDLFRGGGIETYTREVGRRLVARGHAVTVYSTRGNDSGPAEWEGMRIAWLPRIRPYWAEKSSGAVAAACREMFGQRPDIIHLHSVAAGALAAILRFRGAPCILQMHGLEWMRTRWGGWARFVLKTMERMSVASADFMTAVSQEQCGYFKDQYEKDCQYIPTAADIKEPATPRLISDLGLRPHGYVLFAARLVPEKGAHHLIRAFRHLSPQYPLVIAGEAPARSSYRQELLSLADGDPKIRFAGHVSGRLLEELFSNAALFVQPSELEGLSIGLLEAMSYGLPCLASDIPANREVIGDAGLLFHNKDVNDLERVLRWSIGHEEADREYGAKARRRVQTLFSWNHVVDELEDLYEHAVWNWRVGHPVRTRRAAAAPGSLFGHRPHQA